jgi:predicted nuclease of predicted toxin-antitoxin system
VNCVADEDIDSTIVAMLREDGHQVWHFAEMDPGAADEQVLHLAQENDAVLLTADKDFGELVFRQHRISRGVILVRLAGVSPRSKASIVRSVVDAHGEELLDAFTVVTAAAVRIRRRI